MSPPVVPPGGDEPNWLQPVKLDPNFAAIVQDVVETAGIELSQEAYPGWDIHLSPAETVDQMDRYDPTRSRQGRWLAEELQELWRCRHLTWDDLGRVTYRRPT